jgi:hypothetical protein
MDAAGGEKFPNPLTLLKGSPVDGIFPLDLRGGGGTF